MTMTKKDLVDIVAEKTGNTKNHTRIIIENALEVFTDWLADEGRLELRNFGVFRVRTTPRRMGRNPMTKESAEVPSRRIVQFKAGKNMKELVNLASAPEATVESHSSAESV